MLITFVLIMLGFCLLYLFFICNCDYWRKCGINGPNRPLSGKLKFALTQQHDFIKELDNVYREFKTKEDFVGVYFLCVPQLLILNPELSHQIHEQDFDHFHDNEISTMIDKSSDITNCNNPYVLAGDEWRERRDLMKAGFTEESIKNTFLLIRQSSKNMTSLIEDQLKSAPTEGIDVNNLAQYPKVQERLQLEILEELEKNGSISYETLKQLPYLDACIHEAIRILPVPWYSAKICTKPILLNNKSGRSIKLEKGEVVVLPFYSFMHDEDYYPNNKEFQPERFLGPNGSIINEYCKRGIYYGFGIGPRFCLGKDFGLLQLKTAVVEILSNFNIKLNDKTHPKEILKIDLYGLRMLSEILLDFQPRNQNKI